MFEVIVDRFVSYVLTVRSAQCSSVTASVSCFTIISGIINSCQSKTKRENINNYFFKHCPSGLVAGSLTNWIQPLDEVREPVALSYGAHTGL